MALHGTELLNLPVATSLAAFVAVTTDRTAYRRGENLDLPVHVAPGTATDPVDAYVGLRRADGSVLSLAAPGRVGFALGAPGPTPAPVLSATPVNLNYASRVATRTWGASDPTGGYTAYVVLVRAGQSALAPANWLAVDAVHSTVNP